MRNLLLLVLSMAPTGAASRLDSAILKGTDVAPDCQLTSTQPLDPQGGGAQLAHAEGSVEQIFTCHGDVGVVDFFDMGRSVEVGLQQLEQARWGGLQPPERLHDGLLRRGAVLADVSGSRATAFLLQTRLQAKEFRLLGGTADFDTISQGMEEERAARAPAISGRYDPGAAERAHVTGSGIEWMGYEAGLREAASSGRPVCLYFYTTWCPHCRNFEHVLEDPRVIEKSRAFVMVKLNDEREPELARKYSPDGRYFPRMLFLSPQGELDPTLTNGSIRNRYTVSENDPRRLLVAMRQALAKFER